MKFIFVPNPCGSSVLRLFVAVLAPIFPLAQGPPCRPNPPPAGNEGITVPIMTSDEMVKTELLNLDKLLENNPKIEEALRRQPRPDRGRARFR